MEDTLLRAGMHTDGRLTKLQTTLPDVKLDAILQVYLQRESVGRQNSGDNKLEWLPQPIQLTHTSVHKH